MAKKDQVLKFDAVGDVLRFQGPFTEISTVSIKISNPSKKFVYFKVKTTAPKRYCVKPNQGTLAPGETVDTKIMLQPIDFEKEKTTLAKHKFLVLSMFASDDVATSQSSSCFTDDFISKVFSDAPRQDIMDTKFTCIHEMPGCESEPVMSPCMETPTGEHQDSSFNQHDLADSMRFRAQYSKPTCSEHENEELDTFCKTCSIRICELCCKGSHMTCDWQRGDKFVRELKRTAGSRGSEIRDILSDTGKDIDKIREIQKEMKAMIDDYAEMLISSLGSHISEEENGVKQNVSSKFEKMKKMANFFENELLQADTAVVMETEEEYRALCRSLSSVNVVGRNKFFPGQLSPETLKSMFGQVL